MRLTSLGVALCTLLLAACEPELDDAAPAPTLVRVTAAELGPAAPSIQTNGVVTNKDEIRLSFKVGGVIRRLAVHEGERVRKGQRLAEIEQTEIDAQVEQARQAFAKAQRDVERGERLYSDQVISLEQLQDLRTQAAVADAARKSAEFNRNYAAIIAPRDGAILRRLAEERELVQAGAPILVFGGQDRGFVVRTGLADREIVQVQLGDIAQIRVDALPEAQLTGKVTEIASAADPGSGMFDVEIAIEDAPAALRSGLVAKLKITPASAAQGARVYVPIGAIVEGAGRTARVFVYDQEHARKREVQVAFIESDRVALSSGLEPGEQVITDGAQYVEDGELVAIAAASTAAGASP